MRNRVSCLLLLATVVFGVSLCPAATGNNSHDRTHTGHTIDVVAGEQVSDATCFGCSIHVRGHVTGDATTFGGSIVIEDQGQVDGDATTFAGNIRLDKGVKVAGDVTVFGGRIHRDPTAVVGGEVTNFGGPVWIVLMIVVPLGFLGLFIALIVWLIQRLMRPSVPVTA